MFLRQWLCMQQGKRCVAYAVRAAEVKEENWGNQSVEL
jgi:hypothetical protein